MKNEPTIKCNAAQNVHAVHPYNRKYWKIWSNYNLIINVVTKEGQNEPCKDTQALAHFPAKLKGRSEVHGYAKDCDEQIGNTRRGFSDILFICLVTWLTEKGDSFFFIIVIFY